jgi:hypothetical protein
MIDTDLIVARKNPPAIINRRDFEDVLGSAVSGDGEIRRLPFGDGYGGALGRGWLIIFLLPCSRQNGVFGSAFAQSNIL